MPYLKIYIHFVWSTKNRERFLDSRELRNTVWYHMKENAGQKDIFIDTINGYHDHCHALIALGAEQSPSKVMQLVKGESSFWINKHNLCESKFEWQQEYYAASVSESALDKVRAYIRNQERHHSKIFFLKEYDHLVDEFGFMSLNDT